MIDKALFSSASEEWETPQEFFDILDKKWDFTLDPCATKENAKCDLFYTKEDDGLAQIWASHKVWCNPPYGRQVDRWITKAVASSRFAFTVMLLPARTDTRWFQKLVKPNAFQIEFLAGRLKFGGMKTSAPFPSMLVYF